MAANKFATTLHRNTNKITLILVYAFLEWALIALLLLNSLFSYLIVKFADYFGLKRPCLWCSRLDHVFEPQRSKNFVGDLVCEAHAKEISGLEFCLSHRRLAESRDLCEDCSSEEFSKRFGFFPWTKQFEVINGDDESEFEEEEEEEEEEKNECSCCGASLNSKRLFNPCILIKPSFWKVYDDDQGFEADNSDHSRSEFIAEEEENREIDNVIEFERIEVKIEEESCTVQVNSDQVSDERSEEEEEEEEEKGDKFGATEIPAPHLDFCIGQEDCTLIPISVNRNSEEEEEEVSFGIRDVVLDFDDKIVAENWHSLGETLMLEMVSPSDFEREVLMEEGNSKKWSFQPILVSQGTQTVFEEVIFRQGAKPNVQEEEEEEEEKDVDGDISIGTEIPDHDQVETCSYNPCQQEDEDLSTTSCIDLHFNNNHVDAERELVEFKRLTLTIDKGRECESEEELVDSPRSTESLGEVAVERLRAALDAVYAELEEERSAAAVAASQTMAMINRLQEEKAAVVMESVHYRRVMEEQSEYHREALRSLRSDLDTCRALLFDSHDSDSDSELDSDTTTTTTTPPEESILYLDEERLSILDQPRGIEGVDVKDENALFEGLTGYRYRHCRNRGAKAKRLLPLFEEAGELEEEVGGEDYKGLGLLADILCHLKHLGTVEDRAVVDGVLS